MLVDGRKKRVLRLKDMNSLISFEEWLKRNLSIYPKDTSISEAHLSSFLEYLGQQVEEQRLEDKKAWKDQLEALISRMEKR